MCSKILSRPLEFPVKLMLSDDVKVFIDRLLQRNQEVRLGYKNGLENCKEFDFFKGYNLNWENIFHKLEIPPFVPTTDSTNYFDTQNFDTQFTKLKPKESAIFLDKKEQFIKKIDGTTTATSSSSSVNKNAVATPRSNSSSTTNNHKRNDIYLGFSFS